MFEVQSVVAQESEPNATVGVGATRLKSNPVTVMLTPPESGAFKVVTADNAGESNEKIGELVPATAPTVTADSPNIVRNVLLRQEIVVIEVQDEVLHATISSALVAESLLAPKSRPDTVTELPPLTAIFSME